MEAGADQGEARADLRQDRVPQEEGPEDQLAQVELLGHDDPQLLGRDAQHPARRDRHGGEVHALAGEQTDLPEELRRSVAGDDALVGAAAVLDDLGLTGEEDDQVVGLVPIGEQTPRRRRRSP